MQHVHPFWQRLHKVRIRGRLSVPDLAAWFSVPYRTAYDWATNYEPGRRGPWAAPENEHRLYLLEKAVEEDEFPLAGVSAKNRREAVRKLFDEYNARLSQPSAAE